MKVSVTIRIEDYEYRCAVLRAEMPAPPQVGMYLKVADADPVYIGDGCVFYDLQSGSYEVVLDQLSPNDFDAIVANSGWDVVSGDAETASIGALEEDTEGFEERDDPFRD